MLSAKTNIIADIYDAVLSDEYWPRALKSIANEFDAVGAILMAADQVGLPFKIESASYPIELVRQYFVEYGHYDGPVLSEALAKAPPFKLLKDEDVWGDVSRFESRPDYKWNREVIGCLRRAGVRLSASKGWSDVLLLQFGRDWKTPPFIEDMPLRSLLPHLAKAVEINRQFSILRAQYRAALAALDRVLIGTCITSSSGHVVAVNREARRIHDLDDGIRLSASGHLTCQSSELSNELTTKILSIASTASGMGSQSEVLMSIPRPSGQRSFMIEMAPLRDSLGELEPGLSGAVIFIVDVSNSNVISTSRLAKLYHLTEAESEVCQQMVGGLSAAEIAMGRSVSEDTVKSQFKAIYSKTAVSRRADLVRLALTVDPPIEKPSGSRPPS